MRYINAFLASVLAFVGVTLASIGVAHAASDVPDPSLLDLAKPVIAALTSGSPALACALALVLGVSLIRKFGATKWPFLTTDVGGTVLTFLASLGAACAAAFAGGALPSLSLLWTAVVVAAGASGGYTAIKRLAAPALRYVESKLPAWLQTIVTPLLNVVLWAFEGNAAAVATADAAGAAAVAAKPAPGIASVVGPVTVFPPPAPAAVPPPVPAPVVAAPVEPAPAVATPAPVPPVTP